MRCSVYIATSLDGFIARRDGSIDWLDEASARVPAGEDCGYAAFTSTVDTLIMGRKTYEQVLTFGNWSYELPVVVMSRTLTSLADGAPSGVTLSNDAPAQLVARLGKEGCAHLYVDGGATIRSFLAADLIDDVTVTVIPLLLGDGLPLFGGNPRDVPLEHVNTRAFDFGFVQHHYRINHAR